MKTKRAERHNTRSFWTVFDFAAVLRCHPETVRRWYRRGLMPPPQNLPGRQKRWSDAVAQRWLSRSRGRRRAA